MTRYYSTKDSSIIGVAEDGGFFCWDCGLPVKDTCPKCGKHSDRSYKIFTWSGLKCKWDLMGLICSDSILVSSYNGKVYTALEFLDMINQECHIQLVKFLTEKPPDLLYTIVSCRPGTKEYYAEYSLVRSRSYLIDLVKDPMWHSTKGKNLYLISHEVDNYEPPCVFTSSMERINEDGSIGEDSGNRLIRFN
jgi:hypothetical protein